jgi:hypothetical protein
MTKKELLDIYCDYLVSAFGPTTGTGLAELLKGSISRDQVQRFLSGPVLTKIGVKGCFIEKTWGGILFHFHFK